MRTSVKFMAVYRHKDKYSLIEMRRFFDISRSGYAESVQEMTRIVVERIFAGNME